MITPAQHRILVKEYQNTGGVISHAAMKANMHRGTAARYLKANAGPEDLKQERGPRTYRTRSDPLEDIMPEAARYLETAPEIEAKGLLAHLKIAKPEVAEAVALRTFQRGVKVWRALNGPPKEVFFPQAHEPGRAAQFDWKRAGELGITIAGVSAQSNLPSHRSRRWSNAKSVRRWCASLVERLDLKSMGRMTAAGNRRDSALPQLWVIGAQESGW